MCRIEVAACCVGLGQVECFARWRRESEFTLLAAGGAEVQLVSARGADPNFRFAAEIGDVLEA